MDPNKHIHKTWLSLIRKQRKEDARAMVSDKTITARISSGWDAEATIATPRN